MTKRSKPNVTAPARSGAAAEKERVRKVLSREQRIKQMEELGMEIADDDDQCGFVVIVGAPRPNPKS
jgi:hypothetical protein